MERGTSMSSFYDIPRRRLYQLKRYCLRYHYWADALGSIDEMRTGSVAIASSKDGLKNNPVADIAEFRSRLIWNMEIIERCSRLTDDKLGHYIFTAVVEGLGYDKLKLKTDISVSKPTYYKYYKRFFWILDKQLNESRKKQMLQ